MPARNRRTALPPHSSWVDKALKRIAASDVDESLLPRRLVRALEAAVADLESLRRPVVLHGDLHHENILGWELKNRDFDVGDFARRRDRAMCLVD